MADLPQLLQQRVLVGQLAAWARWPGRWGPGRRCLREGFGAYWAGLELAKALQGAAEANALAAKGIAIERRVESEQIAGSEALALHAAAYNGTPDPVFHLVERAIGIVTALAAVEPDPRAGESDMLLGTALRAATALAQLLQARHGFTTAETVAQRDATTAALINAGEQLRQAAEEIDGFFRLAEASWAAGRRGRDDLN